MAPSDHDGRCLLFVVVVSLVNQFVNVAQAGSYVRFRLRLQQCTVGMVCALDFCKPSVCYSQSVVSRFGSGSGALAIVLIDTASCFLLRLFILVGCVDTFSRTLSCATRTRTLMLFEDPISQMARRPNDRMQENFNFDSCRTQPM